MKVFILTVTKSCGAVLHRCVCKNMDCVSACMKDIHCCSSGDKILGVEGRNLIGCCCTIECVDYHEKHDALSEGLKKH